MSEVEGGEIIRVSINSISNALSSHLSNLEGLTCTTEDEDKGALCDSNITHFCTSSNKIVPRTIFMDNVSNFGNWMEETPRKDEIMTWGGQVEIIRSLNDSGGGTTNEDLIASNPFGSFHDLARTVHQNRYQRKDLEKHDNNNQRYMNWDDLEEEEEEDEDTQRRKRALKKQKQIQNEYDLSERWDECVTNLNGKDISWYDYLLPPHPPESCFVTSYTDDASSSSTQAMEESIRVLLEGCNAMSGFQLLCDSSSFLHNASLCTDILQYIQQECKSAASFSLLPSFTKTENLMTKLGKKQFIQKRILFHALADNSTALLPLDLASTPLLDSPALYQRHPLFFSSAKLATALHSTSLSYRLSPSSFRRAALSHWNPTFTEEPISMKKIPFSQFVQSLSHFNHVNLMELDASYVTPLLKDDSTMASQFSQFLLPISHSNLDPLSPIPMHEPRFLSSSTHFHDYHSIFFSNPRLEKTIPCNIDIIESYRPKQCTTMGFDPAVPMTPPHAYWKNPDFSTSSISTLLSNSSRSHATLKTKNELWNKLSSSKMLVEPMMEHDDILELTEFFVKVEKLYAPQTRMGMLLDDDEDAFFDINED